MSFGTLPTDANRPSIIKSAEHASSCQNGVNSLQTVYINLAHVYKMERTAYRQCTSISLMSTKWSEQPTDSVHQSRSCLQNGANSLQTVYINLAHVYKMERTAYRQCTSISLMSTKWSEQPTDSVHQSRSCLQNNCYTYFSFLLCTAFL